MWTGALDISNDDNRDWKQQLPHTLDFDEYYVRDHIQNLMSMRTHLEGSGKFIALAEPFLLVITHHAMLDCLAIDTAVEGIYHFVGSRNGS